MSFATWRPFERVQAAFSPRAAVERGAALLAAGKSRTAFQLYARAARTGLADAEYRVGRCYIEGDGVPPSRSEGIRWLEQAACRGHVEAQLLLAAICLHGPPRQSMDPQGRAGLFDTAGIAGPDHVAAMRWARLAAEHGSGEAQALLAFILTSGPEHVRNLDEADLWYERSAAAGCPQGLLGHAVALARKGGDHSTQREVVAHLRKAAEAELPAALYLLGVAGEHGLGVVPNQTEAAEYYRRAARKGHRSAQLQWGLALMRGRGVQANACEGETWLRRAALAGDPQAAAVLGELYARDGDLPANHEESASWLRRAAEAGHKGAARSLGLLCLTGAGVMRDREEAETWLRIAAADNASACAELGNLLLDGIGDEDDRVRICREFEQAAASGDPVAAFNYAVCLAEAVGVERDDRQAAVWLRKAADRLPDAQFWYGRFLLEGRGVKRDPTQGRGWIARAAESGHPTARALLAHDRGDPAGKQNPDKSRRRISLAPTEERPGIPDGVASERIGRVDRTSTEGAMEYQRDFCRCGSGLRSDRCCDLDAGYAAPAEVGGQIDALVCRAREAFASGDLAAAESLCIHVLDGAPRVPDALWMLCQIRQRAGRQRATMALLRRLVAIDPNHLEATQELAALLFQRGDMAAAEPLARNAVRLAPLHPRSHKLMAMVLTEDRRPQPGEYHYRRAIELSHGADPILQANLAWNLKCQGRIAEARRLYEESAKAAPDVFQTWLGWARLEEADRDFTAARCRLDEAARIRPNDPTLRLERAVLLSREGDDLAALAELEPPDPKRGREGACATADLNSYALLEKGRILDRLRRYDEAFACFDEAKRREREATGMSYYDRQAHEAAKRLRSFFVGERVRLLPSVPAPEKGAQPIFILGFPRSGTTLAEQALSNHPRISAGDELPFINEFTDAIPRLLGSPLSYPEALSELWMGDNRHGLELLRDIYLQKAEARGVVEPGSAWFTDKMPLNEMHLGLIALIFPCSPLIHVLRHPLDVILSVFSHHLTHGYFCGLALETIARHYVRIMDLVEHYRTEMTLRYLPVRYEDMVEDMAGSVHRMLDFVGESFDPRCVSFHRNQRLPHTPSYAQVVEPIYDRAKFRYRRYLKHLDPVIPIVAPTMSRLGYALD